MPNVMAALPNIDGALYSPPQSLADAPSNTKSPGLTPTSIPSGILMHLAVWPQ